MRVGLKVGDENVRAALPAGVIRSDCTYVRSWQAYKCFGLDYRMLVIESLDADTETRRLSPVAVLGDGYVDLVNGERECPRRNCRFPLWSHSGTQRFKDFYWLRVTLRDVTVH